MLRETWLGLVAVCLLVLLSFQSSMAATETIFADGFESGDLSAWSLTASPIGGRFVVAADNSAAMTGAYGMEVSTTSGIVGPAYTQDNSPNGETNYHASFMLDINNFDFLAAPGDQPEHHLLMGRDPAGNRVFDVALVRYAFGTIALEAHVLDNSDMIGTLNSTELTPGTHTIMIDWEAADPGSNNGFFRLTVDGSIIDSASLINNDADVINDVQFGALPYTVNSASGIYYLDAFDSWREVPDMIPTLTEWGMIFMALLMAGAGVIIIKKKQATA